MAILYYITPFLIPQPFLLHTPHCPFPKVPLTCHSIGWCPVPDPVPHWLFNCSVLSLCCHYLSLFSASFCTSDRDNTENMLMDKWIQCLLINFKVILNLYHNFSVFTVHRFHIGLHILIFEELMISKYCTKSDLLNLRPWGSNMPS